VQILGVILLSNGSYDCMLNRLQNMRDCAKRISKSMTHDDEVSAVLLFGSVYTGNIHPESDLDLVIVRK